jgi:hypothetical protein
MPDLTPAERELLRRLLSAFTIPGLLCADEQPLLASLIAKLS